MNDTHPAIEAKFRKLMMAKSCQERLLMGCSMFDSAKQIVRSSIVQKQPKISLQEIKIEVFLRFYGTEFNESEKRKILAALRKDTDIHG
ncbi:MAG: hypothetical protein KKI13_01855 [Candidatus Omnitrophica bacterium]|nr:hypothetical protein [Candidatus Omnitrophota bacterium]MCG2705566.1 hypothetical protein [Candidatus Omnitrophota bacterium]